MDRIFSDKQNVTASHVLDTMIDDFSSIDLEGNNSTDLDSDVEIVYQDQNKTNSHFNEDEKLSESPKLEYLENYNVDANNEPSPSQVMNKNNLKNTLSDGSTIEKKSISKHMCKRSGPRRDDLPKLEINKRNNLVCTLEKSISLKEEHENRKLNFYIEQSAKQDRIKIQELNEIKEVKLRELEETKFLKRKELNDNKEFRRERAVKEDEFCNLEIQNKKSEIQFKNEAARNADRLAFMINLHSQGNNIDEIERMVHILFK
ncbi:hypothetical protein O181_016387 [Austropuccinia psidii MF-1]|uniref:Uncharacterized protein n=1 Tax=Austropuccinia psidii MF-1 TaxID=1389203 RepID=A0A9Q3C5I7_9BASI|nr:hypothetical protein [Austropuccinia psidii MF-1]